ncbi:MAG: GNAT family N-acetyltransferase [Actinomycetota bacterium]
MDVQLRDVADADLPILFEQQLDAESVRMSAFPARDRDAFMAHWSKIRADETVILRTVVVDGEVAGDVVCWDQDGERLVGYWIGRPFWGRGIATRVLAEFLGQVPERPLHAHVAKHNLGSIRVLEKCGFTVAREEIVSVGDGDIEELVMVLGAGP